MTVIALPSIPGFSAVEWTLERNVATFESPLTRVAQRLSRTGHRWRVKLQCPPYQGDDAGIMAAWLDQVSRGDRWFYLSPPQNSVRGNWNPAELVTNGDFRNGLTTGWTAQGSGALSVNARRLKVRNGAATAGYAQSAVGLATEAGKPHAFMFDRYAGNVVLFSVELRRSDTGVGIVSENTSAIGRSVLLAAVPAGTNASYINLFCNTSILGDHVYYNAVSLCRCLQVNGASQTGNRLNADGGPASVNAALRAGDFFSVKVGTLQQLVRLVEDFDTDSSGAGTLVFEPVLRAAPADNEAVIVRQPFARFRVAANTSTEAVRAPNFRGFTLEGIEDITP